MHFRGEKLGKLALIKENTASLKSLPESPTKKFQILEESEIEEQSILFHISKLNSKADLASDSEVMCENSDDEWIIIIILNKI